MENRIKECQGDLFADRTSAATMRANHSGSGSPRSPTSSFATCAASASLTPVRRRDMRHDPFEAVQDRRACPGQRPPRSLRAGVSPVPRQRMAPGRRPPRKKLLQPEASTATQIQRGARPRPTEDKLNTFRNPRPRRNAALALA